MNKHLVRLAALCLLPLGSQFTLAQDGSSKESPPAKPAESRSARKTPKVYPAMGTIERLDPALDKLIAPGAVIEKLASGFAWAEGPVWVRKGGYLLFSDVPRNIVFQWREGAGTSEYLTPSGYTGDKPRGGEPGSNGLTVDAEGRLVLCQHGDRQVARLEKDRKMTVLAQVLSLPSIQQPERPRV